MDTQILKSILEKKKREVKEKKSRKFFLNVLKRDESKKKFFSNSIQKYFKKNGKPGVIGEIKLFSPSQGVLGSEDDVERKVRQYKRAGVMAISVVVDQKFFGGNISLIPKIKSIISLPILCKDFIIDPIQIEEAVKVGADAILLIVKIVSPNKLKELVNTCQRLNIEPVIEVNSQKELDLTLETHIKCIAINARDLVTFKVDVDKACLLGKQIPKDRIFLAFSGVSFPKEVYAYKKAGAKAFLIGTYFMQSTNVVKSFKKLHI